VICIEDHLAALPHHQHTHTAPAKSHAQDQEGAATFTPAAAAPTKTIHLTASASPVSRAVQERERDRPLPPRNHQPLQPPQPCLGASHRQNSVKTGSPAVESKTCIRNIQDEPTLKASGIKPITESKVGKGAGVPLACTHTRNARLPASTPRKEGRHADEAHEGRHGASHKQMVVVQQDDNDDDDDFKVDLRHKSRKKRRLNRDAPPA
jgi:hypothetical protein